MAIQSSPRARRTARPRRVGSLLGPVAVLAMLGVTAFGVLTNHHGAPLVAPVPDAAPSKPALGTPLVAAPERSDRLLDPTLALEPEALKFAPLAALEPALPPPAPAEIVAEAPAEPAPVAAPPAVGLQNAPLPVPRPPEFRAPRTDRLAERANARRARTAAAAPAEDTRSFFERLLGIETTPSTASAPALAYAALDTKPTDPTPRPRLSPFPGPVAGGGTAVYDISARTVTLPNGTRLEAHSGLGDKIDDPRYVHVRMRGATPPATYDLTEREALFHGVRAIRLTPVGGSAAIHGRDGILAHTYMLGPRGDSNGCVSFRDYDKFLQAFLRGEVSRMVVVAGNGSDALPRFADRR